MIGLAAGILLLSAGKSRGWLEPPLDCTKNEERQGGIRGQPKMAAQKMKEQYDRSKKDAPEFKVGDLLLLNMKNLRTTRQMKKLENLRDGPFKVLKKSELLPTPWTSQRPGGGLAFTPPSMSNS